MKQYDLASGKCFVYGSNRGGRHGAGAARYAALYCGAIHGLGEGPMPDWRSPKCYAIPTKDADLKILSLEQIALHVNAFIQFAVDRPDLEFFVTALGTGLSRYSHSAMAPLFVGKCPSNCELPAEWLAL